jgi:hypothetical protein
MKRFIILSFLLIIVVIAYLSSKTLRGQNNEVYEAFFIKLPINSAQRGITQIKKWKAFFPGKSIDDSTYEIDNTVFKIKRTMLTGIQLESYEKNNPNLQWTADINAIEMKDSAFIQFYLKKLPTEETIWSRLSTNSKTNQQKNIYEKICRAAVSYFESIKNVYGYNIIETNVKDSLLLTTNITSVDTPSIKTIYELIDNLKSVMKSNGEIPVDSPMLNITQVETNLISTTVAIPIHRRIDVMGNFKLKNMVLGRILEANVDGGKAAIKHAFNAMENYRGDRQKISPAMPFETLLNYRQGIPDSLWRTKISLPVY